VTRNRIFGLALAATVFALDQGVKWLVVEPLALRDMGSIYVMRFFNLTWTENFGVSLGLLTAESTEMRWLLVGLTGTIAVAVLVWMLRETHRIDVAALALVLGGALGNIRDRIFNGFVIDYADLHFGTFRPFLVFNIADAAITLGVLIILARSFLSREKRGNAAPEPDDGRATEN
jgi:signal peptidase II